MIDTGSKLVFVVVLTIRCFYFKESSALFSANPW